MSNEMIIGELAADKMAKMPSWSNTREYPGDISGNHNTARTNNDALQSLVSPLKVYWTHKQVNKRGPFRSIPPFTQTRMIVDAIIANMGCGRHKSLKLQGTSLCVGSKAISKLMHILIEVKK